MNRRTFIQNMSSLGLLFFLPGANAFANENKPMHFVGIGGCGTLAIKHFQKLRPQFTYTIMDKQFETATHSSIQRIMVPKPYTPMQVNGHQIERVPYTKCNATEVIPFTPKLQAFFQKEKHYVLLAGLGGMTATYLMEQIMPYLQANNIGFTAICSTPFTYEGRIRNGMAQRVLIKNKTARNLFIMNNQIDVCVKFGNLPFTEAFVKSIDNMNDIWERKSRGHQAMIS